MRVIPDHVLAALTIWQEARGESFEGKVAVAQVIRNRMAVQHKNVAGVVLAPYQFSGWNTEDRNRIIAVQLDAGDSIYLECAQAWDLAPSTRLGLEDAYFYLNPKAVAKLPSWANEAHYIKTIGSHWFYRA